MPDVFDPVKRSAAMARIRSSGNKATELRMIALFHAHGITGWRRKLKLFGKPDFVFRGERIAIFVDGCFWHGCPRPKHAPLPKTRSEWWGGETLAQSRTRPDRHAHVARGWMDGSPHLGMLAPSETHASNRHPAQARTRR